MSAKILATPTEVSDDFSQPLQADDRLVPKIKSWFLLSLPMPVVD